MLVQLSRSAFRVQSVDPRLAYLSPISSQSLHSAISQCTISSATALDTMKSLEHVRIGLMQASVPDEISRILYSLPPEECQQIWISLYPCGLLLSKDGLPILSLDLMPMLHDCHSTP